MNTMQTIIARAASDPEFARGLARDARGTLRAAGLSVTEEELAALTAGADGQGGVEELKPRIAHGGANGTVATG